MRWIKMIKLSCFFPFTLSLCILLVLAPYALARGGWDDPPDGWDGIYEFDDLDDWVHNNGSDAWDESAPGEESKASDGEEVQYNLTALV
jgi:hypothetical protein